MVLKLQFENMNNINTKYEIFVLLKTSGPRYFVFFQ